MRVTQLGLYPLQELLQIQEQQKLQSCSSEDANVEVSKVESASSVFSQAPESAPLPPPKTPEADTGGPISAPAYFQLPEAQKFSQFSMPPATPLESLWSSMHEGGDIDAVHIVKTCAEKSKELEAQQDEPKDKPMPPQPERMEITQVEEINLAVLSLDKNMRYVKGKLSNVLYPLSHS